MFEVEVEKKKSERVASSSLSSFLPSLILLLSSSVSPSFTLAFSRADKERRHRRRQQNAASSEKNKRTRK